MSGTPSIIPNKSFKLNDLYQWKNICVYIIFSSPIIVAIGITSLSFIFQNFKGFVYLGFLIGSCIVRTMVYSLAGVTKFGCEPKPNPALPLICDSIQYTDYGNSTFSTFVISFTIMYLSIPMFSNSSVNYWFFSALLFYLIADIGVKVVYKCVGFANNKIMLLSDLLFGATIASLMVTLMYAGGSGQHLFFNEYSSDKEMCYQPSKQTFKCSLYNNGELITSL